MVFETSCWATGGIGPQCDDNSIVQRRPKIDYFDVNSIKTTPAITSPISHISSNGYYGYCPTTNLNTNCDSEMNENIVSMGNSTDDFPMHEAAAESMCSEQPTSTTTHVQSYQGQSIDKRKRTNDQCNVLETKRSRNCFSDCIEGLYSVRRYIPILFHLVSVYFFFRGDFFMNECVWIILDLVNFSSSNSKKKLYFSIFFFFHFFFACLSLTIISFMKFLILIRCSDAYR